MAVGIGEVEMKCKSSSGESTVTFSKVRHAPEAQFNLFSVMRATEAGAQVVFAGRTAQVIVRGVVGVVHVEAVKRGGLYEVETVEKRRAFLARAPVKKKRVSAKAKKPVRAESVTRNVVNVIEVDLEELDDEMESSARVLSDVKVNRAKDTILVRKGPGLYMPHQMQKVNVENTIRVGKGPELYLVHESTVKNPEEPEGVGKDPEKVEEFVVAGKYSVRVRRKPGEWYKADVGAATEDVGAALTEDVGAQEPKHGVERMGDAEEEEDSAQD